MTLAPAQWQKIYDGIPVILQCGAVFQKTQTRSFVNPLNESDFPRLFVTVVSQGIPVGIRRELKSELDKSRRIHTTTYGQLCRARVTLAVESPNPDTMKMLACDLVTALYADELGVNPLHDKMQFRGCDPPQYPEPYETYMILNGKKGLAKVHVGIVDFFVEYWFTWTKEFDVMQEFEAEIGHPPLDFIGRGDGRIFLPYAVDVIISR